MRVIRVGHNEFYFQRRHVCSIVFVKFCCVFVSMVCLGGCLVSSESDPAGQLSQNEVCTREHCAEEMSECESSESCWLRIKCLFECAANDAACRAACGSPQIALDSQSLELNICRSNHCQGASDTCGSSMFDSRGAGCAQCVQKNCCAAATLCAGDRDCARVMHSRSQCDNPYCWRNDGLGYSAAHLLLESTERLELDNCMKNCNSECRMGTDYDCLFKYSPPKGYGEAILIATPIDLLSRNPIDGVEIELSAIVGDSYETIDKKTYKLGANTEFQIQEGQQTVMLVTHPNYFTTRYVLTRPVVGVENWVLPMTTKSLISLAENTLDFEADFATRGMLFVSAKDCTTQPAPDVIIAASNMDEETAWAYTAGPSFDLDAQSTDDSGFATFFNMPAGKTTVTMTHAPTQKAMATAAANVEVGIITWLGVFPSAL